MNAPTHRLTGVEALDIRLASFYRVRSEILDAFADVEQSLLTYISNNTQNNMCVTAPLGHKIEVAKKVPAGPNRSKELKAKADQELSELAQILPLRASIVHSHMELAVTTSSQFIAIFKNTKDVDSNSPEALIFHLSELEHFVSKLKTLQKSLAKALAAQNHSPKPKT
jgi:hypothetical protein